MHRNAFLGLLLSMPFSLFRAGTGQQGWGPRVSQGQRLRQDLLDLAHFRLDEWYLDQSHLEDAKEKDGVTFRMSKEDKACGQDGVPLTFVEFDVDDVRPVDVFNVLADAASQSNWDGHCQRMAPLGDQQNFQARGFAGLFPVPAMSSREVYEWQVVSANFSSEEFWVVFSTLENDEIRQRKSPEAGAVQMENCLAAYRITRKATGTGVHVLNTQQVNSHPYPLTARFVENSAWGTSVEFANALRGQASKQAAQHWPLNQTVVPDWMLQSRSCEANGSAEVGLRHSILTLAEQQLRSPLPEGIESRHQLFNGEELFVHRRAAVCGQGAVPPAEVQLWSAEFHLPGALPAQVFNVLLAKKLEVHWNPLLREMNLTGMMDGARGIHEELGLGGRWSPMDLREWQVASHDVQNGTYVMALTSSQDQASPLFPDHKAVRAALCIAAYEIRPSGEGSSVRFTTHLNPNIWTVMRRVLLPFWSSAYEHALVFFAESLTTEARRVANLTGQSLILSIDQDSLTLLAPPPPNRNDSVTASEVVAMAGSSHGDDGTIPAWRRAFASLNIPKAFGASRDFANQSREVLQLYQLLSKDATKVESDAFVGGQAQQVLQLQSQGEALSSIQLRVIQVIAKFDCDSGPNLPDIDSDKNAKGLSLAAMIVVGLVVVVVLSVFVASCVWRCKKRRRQRRAEIAATLLLSHEACSSTCSQPSNPKNASSQMGTSLSGCTLKPERPSSSTCASLTSSPVDSKTVSHQLR